MTCNKDHAISRTLRGLPILLALSVLTTQAGAATAPAPAMAPPPWKMAQYRVHYEIRADGTYTQRGDTALTILNEAGISASRQAPVMMSSVAGASKPEIEILNAYTLKKDGQKLPASSATPLPPPVLPTGMPGPMLSMPTQPYHAFPNAEVGDTLVTSYKAIQKEPALDGNIILHEAFSPFLAYDDAEVSVTAPASLNLRFDVTGVEKAEEKSSGGMRTWVWKYQNTQPAGFRPGVAPASIHISSFKDAVAEGEAMQKLAMSQPLPPTPPKLRCAVYPGQPNDGPDGADSYQRQVAVFFWGDHRFLERLADDWNSPSCVMDDGRPRIGVLNAGYSQAIDGGDWDKVRNRIEELKKKYPGKAFVPLAEARYWVDYAWDARGSGYASSVTDDGWRLFHERLEKAERTLLDSKPYASALPVWYDEMVQVQAALGHGEEAFETFHEGAKRHKTYYPTYFTMLNFLLPKWGGSWEAVDSFVKWSIENTKDVDGNTLYARLYWSAYGGLTPKERLFKDTRASWPRMKQGFEDMMSRYPKSKWNLNNFAKFACLAGDKKTFLALRKRIGNDIIDAAWNDTNASLDLCEAKYGR